MHDDESKSISACIIGRDFSVLHEQSIIRFRILIQRLQQNEVHGEGEESSAGV